MISSVPYEVISAQHTKGRVSVFGRLGYDISVEKCVRNLGQFGCVAVHGPLLCGRIMVRWCRITDMSFILRTFTLMHFAGLLRSPSPAVGVGGQAKPPGAQVQSVPPYSVLSSSFRDTVGGEVVLPVYGVVAFRHCHLRPGDGLLLLSFAP